MKLIQATFFFLFLQFFSLISFGQNSYQEDIPVMKKWYIDENGRFYVNKHRPVYFRISHSPDENAPSHLLKSETKPQYSNPMYFDMEGYNTLRSPSAVDTTTKQTVIPKQDIRFEVYADGLAPVTKALFDGAAAFSKNCSITYYGAGLRVELESKDKVSGVDKTFYTLNGGELAQYAGAISFPGEGVSELMYYSFDNVGNVEDQKNQKFAVDLTPPTTTMNMTRNYRDSILSALSRIELSAIDSLSGVKSVWYKIDNRPINPYRNPVVLTSLAEGEHKILFYAIDNVNNVSDVTEMNKKTGKRVEYHFLVDRTKPVASINILGDQYKGRAMYISERSTIQLSATDNMSGVDRILYGINKNYQTHNYAQPFKVQGKKGYYYIRYSAVDRVENRSITKTLAVYKDNAAPNAFCKIYLPKFYDRDSLFITKKSRITLHASDANSGVNSLEYAVDGEEFKRYSPFTIKTDGPHVIKYRSTDNVNNVSEIKIQEVVVDNNSPVIEVTFGVNKIGDITKNGKSYPVYPKDTRVFISANDRYSGTSKILYSINRNGYRNYITSPSIAKSAMFMRPGFYKVKIAAYDKLGNKSQKTVEFYTN